LIKIFECLVSKLPDQFTDYEKLQSLWKKMLYFIFI